MKIVLIVLGALVGIIAIVAVAAYVSTAPTRRRQQFFAAVRNNDVERVRRLVRRVDVATLVDRPTSHTPLSMAAAGGNLEMARLFLERNADVNATGSERLTVLDHAVLGGNLELVGLLVERGAVVDSAVDVNRSSNSRSPVTALMLAAGTGNAEMTRLLLDRGADVNARAAGAAFWPDPAPRPQLDVRRMTAGEIVREAERVHALAMQQVTGDNHFKPPLLAAIDNGDTATVRLLLERGADVSWTYHTDATAAMREPFQQGFGPLMYAAFKGRTETVGMLLGSGAQVNGRDDDGQTAFLYAAAGGQVPAMRLLIERGADRQARGRNGRNAVFYAIEANSVDALRYAVDLGVAVNVRDAWGSTALGGLNMAHPDAARFAEILRGAGAR